MSEHPPVVRCAIYNRKSTEEVLEQAFNTLTAQREAAEGYCHVGRLRRDVMLDECWTACTVAIGSRERSSRIPSGSTSASE